MKITILSVGKLKEDYLKKAVSEYTKRLGKYCRLKIVEVEDEKTPHSCSDNERHRILEKEAQRISKYITDDMYTIALAIDGVSLSSDKLAEKIDRLGVDGYSHLCFIIGGSFGLSDHILACSRFHLSFSELTFPHQLMRVILLEQIYRCFRINNNEPYHK